MKTVKYFLILLLIPTISKASIGKTSKLVNSPDEIVAERHQLLMLSAMSYLLLQGKKNEVGGPIASVIAWNVEDISKTPRFAIDRNRNKQKDSSLFHSEVVTLHKAFNLKPAQASPSLWLENTIVYTSLEACPMCASSMLIAHVPKTIHCIDDPGLRSENRIRTVPTVRQYNGRSFILESSKLALCSTENDKMWKEAQTRDQFNIVSYLKDDLKKDKGSFHANSHEAFINYSVQYNENKDLYSELALAILKD